MKRDASIMTTGEAARMVGVSRSTVRRWIRLGLLPAVRLPGGHFRVSRDGLVPWQLPEGTVEQERQRRPARAT